MPIKLWWNCELLGCLNQGRIVLELVLLTHSSDYLYMRCRMYIFSLSFVVDRLKVTKQSAVAQCKGSSFSSGTGQGLNQSLHQQPSNYSDEWHGYYLHQGRSLCDSFCLFVPLSVTQKTCERILMNICWCFRFRRNSDLKTIKGPRQRGFDHQVTYII